MMFGSEPQHLAPALPVKAIDEHKWRRRIRELFRRLFLGVGDWLHGIWS